LVAWLVSLNFALLNNRTAKSVQPKTKNMKQGIHPESYRFVVFKDMSNGHTFLSRSTANTKETIQWEDGNEYPLVKLEISNTSHPFYTGKNMLVDTAGRIDKFKKRYAKKD
jgi:large subunit ribosomal protein L31